MAECDREGMGQKMLEVEGRFAPVFSNLLGDNETPLIGRWDQIRGPVPPRQ
jgi:hypothetical protein